MTPRLKKIIVIGVIAIIIVAVLGVYLNIWTAKKMDKVALGLAAPNFPYRDYTEGELAKMYPQIKYADIATRITPEQTYAKFRQALEENNLETALQQLSKSSRKRYEENVADLTDAHSKGKFLEIYKKYPEKIIQDNMRGNFSQYYFNYIEQGSNRTYILKFSKDANGDWKLDSL